MRVPRMDILYLIQAIWNEANEGNTSGLSEDQKIAYNFIRFGIFAIIALELSVEICEVGKFPQLNV